MTGVSVFSDPPCNLKDNVVLLENAVPKHVFIIHLIELLLSESGVPKMVLLVPKAGSIGSKSLFLGSCGSKEPT